MCPSNGWNTSVYVIHMSHKTRWKFVLLTHCISLLNNQERLVCCKTNKIKKNAWVARIIDDLARSGRLKSVDSEAMQIWWVALEISQSCGVHFLYIYGKITQCCQIVPHVTKILQNFWPSQLNIYIYNFDITAIKLLFESFVSCLMIKDFSVQALIVDYKELFNAFHKLRNHCC